MSVSINSNYAASAASNNLALSNSMLQRSLNRLSSGSRLVNPNDDAGGLAVSMRLSATAKRSGSAATNLNSAVSLLQNQDGVLKVGGKILERMAELQSLWNDATKNSDDKALYDIEFVALQGQLTSLSQEKFNGVDLFGSTSTSIITSADGDQTLTLSAKGLNNTGSVGTESTATSSADFTVPVSANGTLTINGVSIDILTTDTLQQIKDKITAAASPANVTATSIAGTGGANLKLLLTNKLHGTALPTITGTAQLLTDLKLAAPVTAAGTADTRDKVKLLLAATSLGDATVSGVDSSLNTVLIDAQNELAEYRANNGAEQSGLNFASELLVLNRTNLEAAVGRIVDVDVAEESTQLAKWTTLTQAGTAMLAQANQATALVLKLIQ
jgi:flagellin-like hook-associated protein FlgL